jgi:hypothetical protein
MTDSYYDVAQVCLNGHMVNDTWQSSPNYSKDFCPKCGARTIIECPACHKRIQGFYHVPGVITTRSASVRAYCHACGKAYPWTSARIDAAKALAEELEGLSDTEKILLQSTIDDLVTDTPKTTVAVVRFKKLAAKTGKHAVEGFKDILVSVISESVRKQIWG